jgi:hypothetical protein
MAMPLLVLWRGVSMAAQRNGPISVFCHRSSIQLASVWSVGSSGAPGFAGAAEIRGEQKSKHVKTTNDQRPMTNE